MPSKSCVAHELARALEQACTQACRARQRYYSGGHLYHEACTHLHHEALHFGVSERAGHGVD